MRNAQHYINALGLTAHPEGGYYREVFRSGEEIARENLPPRYEGERNFYTSIYFLLEGGQFSAFHRLRSDELWYFHDGAPLRVYCIDSGGRLECPTLGLNAAAGHFPQVCIPRGAWFAAEPLEIQSFSLISCMVSPGFEFNDFELGSAAFLISEFPQHTSLINRLCALP